MISSPGADTDAADMLISVATGSVYAAAGFSGIDPATLWALQRQTDAGMIHDAARCLEAACGALIAAAAPNCQMHRVMQRLPSFDRDCGKWRMLTELSVVPKPLADAACKFGELHTAVAARSTTQRFRLKDLPQEQYARLCRVLLDAIRHDRADLDVQDDVPIQHLKHGAATFVWFLMLNVLSELRALLDGAAGDVRMTLPTHVRVSRALAAPESAWRRLREWLARPQSQEPPMVLLVENTGFGRRSLAHQPLRISTSR